MVVSLGPGRFYGSSLPRPRYFPDPKLNLTRVDPPESMTDPLLSWANEAHWTMGGLSFRRLRLQGRIEGSISKLRNSLSPKKRKISTRFTKQRLSSLDEKGSQSDTEEEVLDLNFEKEEPEKEVEEEEEEGSEEVIEVSNKKRKRVRRLGDEFDQLAREAEEKQKGNKKRISKRNKKEKTKESEVDKPRRVSSRRK